MHRGLCGGAEIKILPAAKFFMRLLPRPERMTIAADAGV
jgi:hypothetical protein